MKTRNKFLSLLLALVLCLSTLSVAFAEEGEEVTIDEVEAEAETMIDEETETIAETTDETPETTDTDLVAEDEEVNRTPLLDPAGEMIYDEDGNLVYVPRGYRQVFDEETGLPLYDEEGQPVLEEAPEIEYPDELRVGHPTITKGDFFTEMFGNDTSDIDVRALIHGYNLVNWDQNQGVYLIDESVVENVQVMEDELGNRTYFLGLYDDLYYSDGTPITAWDYAFSLLLMMSHEVEEIGGKIYRAEHILGYKEYLTGELPYLAGVGVLDDHQLAITLDHEFLPYFFETGLLLCVPYPISVIAPGCKVYAGASVEVEEGYGYGVWIGNEDPTIEEPIFTAELLQETILDPETGYNSHPSVSSGPYVLTDYDYETAHFVINDWYKGAWMFNTLPENFQFDVQEHAGTGTGTLVHNSHTGPNIYSINKVDQEGNESTLYLVKPTIEKISFSVADNDTIAQDLANGKFHLVNKVTYGPTILQCMGTFTDPITPVADHELSETTLHLNNALPEEEEAEDTEEAAEATEATEEAVEEEEAAEEATEEEATEETAEMSDELVLPSDHVYETPIDLTEVDTSNIRFQNYPRIGLAFATFTYDWPTVHEKEVRQAIAWCMDRDQLTQDYCQGFGVRVDGYYGIEQWEYLICTDQLEYPVNFITDETHTDEDLEEWAKHRYMYATTDEEYEEMLKAWEMLSLDNLTVYTVDTAKANALLDDAGWTLNRDGEAYRPGVDDVRCKMVDDELVALDLKMMYPRGNHIVDTIQENFIDNLNACGILMTLVPEDMEELLKSYYREKERTTDMIYLATNFHVIVDPSITYSTDPTPNHLIWNNTYSDDEDLYYRAVDMRKTDPKDVYDYVEKWISFQERYNEVLPTIPIYSNIYFDFYSNQLQNYYVTAHVTWSQAILESYFGEEIIVDEEEEEEGEELEGEEGLEEFEDIEEFDE